jgi:hypothetical protein
MQSPLEIIDSNQVIIECTHSKVELGIVNQRSAWRVEFSGKRGAGTGQGFVYMYNPDRARAVYFVFFGPESDEDYANQRELAETAILAKIAEGASPR